MSRTTIITLIIIITLIALVVIGADITSAQGPVREY